MLVANCQTSTLHSSQQQQQLAQPPYFDTSAVDFDFDIDFDEANDHSVASSPHSTAHSVYSQYSALPGQQLSSFDSIAVPRTADLFSLSAISPASLDDLSMLPATGLMQPDSSWLANNSQLGPKTRISHHHRESSLSSLGSAGPASPFSQNTSNPHIAVTDSVGDGYQTLPFYDEQSYAQAKPLGSTNQDAFYANQSRYGHEPAPTTGTGAYSVLLTPHKQRGDGGLLPPPELSASSNRSRPVSVASSIASDSPATPSLEQADDERRRRNAFHNPVTKLDRTMTDIYGDELYSPSFTVTSMSPSQAAHVPLSPSHDMFSQRLQAISSQHLRAAHTPAPTASGDKSPFRHGSPLAPAMNHHDFAMGPVQVGFGSAQQLREHRKAEQDAQLLRQQMARNSSAATPQTISPKDAILEFQDGDADAGTFPLFPAPGSTGFGASQMPKAEVRADQIYNNEAIGGATYDFFSAPQLPAGVRVPQQYPFIADARQNNSNASLAAPGRISSTEGGVPATPGVDAPRVKSSAVDADAGTYSCTYHGCTQRFETPALLQKHKREGHRQGHGLNGARRVEAAAAGGVTATSLLNSQAGPHRCDRINPSTGKPCGTVFSRPYDLTRHEDTIHNARKQKVRCDICTEEKTFSRADALTRHFRVCHPDIEVPGKHRRRGGHAN